MPLFKPNLSFTETYFHLQITRMLQPRMQENVIKVCLLKTVFTSLSICQNQSTLKLPVHCFVTADHQFAIVCVPLSRHNKSQSVRVTLCPYPGDGKWHVEVLSSL